jgi:hypothetical protein
MPGTNFHCGFQTIAGPTFMEIAHCHHGVEEFLVIVGANVPDIWDFDAEYDILLGEDADHMESFTVNKPVIIRIPPNIWHCPINSEWSTSPFFGRPFTRAVPGARLLPQSVQTGKIL